ncbi:MAG: hypothetical protein U5J99_10125 [Parvularculaceae bacterium]|nr:hypothetical protein [Parvularculaceae bacterium]
MMEEALARLAATDSFLKNENSKLAIECAALNLRKSLEIIAFSAIAPNKAKYESLRSRATKQIDFRKDYHARRIAQDLKKVNPDFFPIALAERSKNDDGDWRHERASGALTLTDFLQAYDSLGAAAHAYNPWGPEPNLHALKTLIRSTIEKARLLTRLHAAFIKSPEFSGVWIYQAATSEACAHLWVAEAEGNYIVKRS